jgi:hypothetical protein
MPDLAIHLAGNDLLLCNWPILAIVISRVQCVSEPFDRSDRVLGYLQLTEWVEPVFQLVTFRPPFRELFVNQFAYADCRPV